MGSLGNLIVTLLSWLSLALDVLWGNGWNPTNSRSPTALDMVEPFVLTPTLLQHVQTSMVLSNQVWFVKRDDDTTRVFQDFNDKAMVKYKDNTCYAAWKGANMLWDQVQSIPLIFSKQVCSSADATDCCQVEKGMYRAYYSRYVDDFEQAVEECVQRCTDMTGGGCPLVLTGHSQGASIAVVAAIRLAQRYATTLITFGQERVHRGHCAALENLGASSYLRITAMCDPGNGRPAYDQFSWMGSILGRHVGTFLLLGGDDGEVATLGYGTDMWMLPLREWCHNSYRFYTNRIRNLEPGPLDGFGEGSLCTRDIECKSRNCSGYTCSD